MLVVLFICFIRTSIQGQMLGESLFEDHDLYDMPSSGPGLNPKGGYGPSGPDGPTDYRMFSPQRNNNGRPPGPYGQAPPPGPNRPPPDYGPGRMQREYYDDYDREPDYKSPPRLPLGNRYKEILNLKMWEEEARGLGPSAKDLLRDVTAKKFDSIVKKHTENRPSPGMGMYWAEEEPPKKAERSGPVQYMPPQMAMSLAMDKLKNLDNIDTNKASLNQSPDEMSQLPLELPPPQQLVKQPRTQTPKPKNNRPVNDDFGAPILWVPINSKDTSDGLARVTNPNTGKNYQFIVNGTVYVPIIDHNMANMLLKTTTPSPPKLTTDTSALRTVAKNLDLKNIDESDWLAMETALGGRKVENKCSDEGCQARCSRLGCESMCQGDTCASGCVGGSCSTFCKGPGCMSMCIGEECSARCEGLNCEARCRGINCEAGCRSFSCKMLKNGEFKQGGGSWNQHYPQYDTQNIMQDLF